MEKEEQLLRLKDIFYSQDKILDEILNEQKNMHEDVTKRNWTSLEDSIFRLNEFSDRFVQLDEERTKVCDDTSLYFSEELSGLFFSVRSKLSKSKIENSALSAYVNATQSFISEVLDKCIPNKRSLVYTNKGMIRKTPVQSLVVNTVF